MIKDRYQKDAEKLPINQKYQDHELYDGTTEDGHPIPAIFYEKDSEIILVCGAGGQAALTGKTLIDMGYTNVSNVGAIGDWEKNGGPMSK